MKNLGEEKIQEMVGLILPHSQMGGMDLRNLATWERPYL